MENKDPDILPYKEEQKEQFPEVLKKCFANISKACKIVGVCRNTYYRWYEDDPEFAKLCDEAVPYTEDVVEDKLMEAIMKGDMRAIIFYCKTKLKKRGYGATLELTGEGGGPLSLSQDNESKALEMLTPDELRAYLAIQKKLHAQTQPNNPQEN